MNPFFDIHLSKKEYEYYSSINIFLHVLYVILILGVAFVNIVYVHYLIILVHLLICAFLMVKFNPFKSGGTFINEYEKKFIFSGSVILLINIMIYEVGISLNVDKVKGYIDSFKERIFSSL